MSAIAELPLEMFDAAVRRLHNAPLLYSFETPIGARECSELVDGLAAGLAELGIGAGDRVGLFLQNDPQFVIATLAVWRLGAITVPANPMLRERELSHHMHDAGAKALIVLDELWRDVAATAVDQTDITVVVTTNAYDLCAERAARAAEPFVSERTTHDLLTLARSPRDGWTPPPAPGPGDTAVLTYTSGTTGPPKGAMSTHANVAFGSETYRSAFRISDDDVILGIAPLYHVTGLIGHIGLALAAGIPIILAHRFDAAASIRLAQHHGATVCIAAITAYMALAAQPDVTPDSLAKLTRAFSGGAPIPPAVVDDLDRRLGVRIRPVYGLTETTGPTHICPLDDSPPTNRETGALAVGKTVPKTTTRILDGDGRPLKPGETGEIAIKGPQVVAGYWRQPEETARAIPGGELHTGDIGVLDADGWLYVVDRSKDMIVASGFKVWPREVEDVLYEHPAVREAAVIGAPDKYRGETVWAYVSLKAGMCVEEPELIAHCKARLAAYKYPRVVHVLDELPKTTNGKILRRELRALATQRETI
ncbi:class I adenylate-forming enzyme family protein [Conexibacter sp. DBS9H8]|uniref:class I adenylate-forming enzyme family protein n=1 Tax=Conexibacter sp. DBS9H8 TaxID=2937801 RepID=UPI0020107D87|nr:AMP-binding protein [Conexibacter sp. DBS9H8]